MSQDSMRAARRALLVVGLCGAGAVQAQATLLTNAQMEERKAKVAQTITNYTNANSSVCKFTFYWEIGQVNKHSSDLTGASLYKSGSKKVSAASVNPPSATTALNIYSAGKWMYGAYVYENRLGVLNSYDKQALRMLAGNNDSDACAAADTVQQCAGKIGGTNVTTQRLIESQDQKDAKQAIAGGRTAVGEFFYAGGHFQAHAARAKDGSATQGMGLGARKNADLVTAMKGTTGSPGLGSDVSFTFTDPTLARGYKMSPANYRTFIRKLLIGHSTPLRLGGTLYSQNPVAPSLDGIVCTNHHDASVCTTSLYSPVNDPAAAVPSVVGQNWNYGYGHWVEPDGTYSSPGAAGFYPWVDSTRKFYGILVRPVFFNATAAVESVECGQLLRKSWMDNVALTP